MQWDLQSEEINALTKEFAKRYYWNRVTSVHVLAGFLGQSCSFAGQILISFGIYAKTVLDHVAKTQCNSDKHYPEADYPEEDLPWDQEAVMITSLAEFKAQRLDYSCVRPEHILLAICELVKYSHLRQICEIFHHLQIDPERVQKKLEEAMERDLAKSFFTYIL